MFTRLFYVLPGPTWVRVLLSAAAVAVVVAVLFEWGFPWFATTVGVDSTSIG